MILLESDLKNVQDRDIIANVALLDPPPAYSDSATLLASGSGPQHTTRTGPRPTNFLKLIRSNGPIHGSYTIDPRVKIPPALLPEAVEPRRNMHLDDKRLRHSATLRVCDPVAGPTALPATGSTQHVSELLGSPPQHTSPRSRQIPDPSRPHRGIAPASVAPCCFPCVRATRLFARVWRRPASVQRHLFPLKRFPAKTQPYSRFRPKHSVPWRPLEWARRMQGLYDETAQVYAVQSLSVPPHCIYNALSWHTHPLRWSLAPSGPTALVSPLAQSTIAFTDDALAAVGRGRNGACLGYCPIRVILPDPLPRLPTRILTGDETPQTHLHLFHDDAESPRPAARDPPIDVSPDASLVTQTSPPLSHPPPPSCKARFPPRTLGARTVASLTVPLPSAPAKQSTALGACRLVYRSRAFYPAAAPCTSQPDAQQHHRTLPTHVPARLTIDGAALPRPSRAPPRGLSAIPPMHDAVASITVCSRRRRLRAQWATPLPATAPQGQPHAQGVAGQPNATAERHYEGEGRAGRALRGRLTHGSTTTSLPHLVSWSPSTFARLMSASNDSRYVPLPLNTAAAVVLAISMLQSFPSFV
ncbi:hypothetical protein B0H14DRAFT_3496711 [Mycena olivaceomarginata]|nr:hypothetical protein B0H14DRAFT_3496711 [Mycena olivaceomarginata]